MALIEYLETDGWRDVLQRSFTGAIVLLQTDRFCPTSSAIDDVRSWLAVGGVSRVQLQLTRQMQDRRLADVRQQEVHDYLKQIVEEHRNSLMGLMADGIIPWQQADFLMICGMAESEFETLWLQIAAGENPFETWMLAHGYSPEMITPIYQLIDRWLVTTAWQQPKPPIDPSLN